MKRSLHVSVKSRAAARGSSTGSAITLILVLALLGLGAWLMMRDKKAEDAPATNPANTSEQSPAASTVVDSEAPTPIEPVDGLP